MAVDNLKNIDGTWYVRVAIPKDVCSGQLIPDTTLSFFSA